MKAALARRAEVLDLLQGGGCSSLGRADLIDKLPRVSGDDLLLVWPRDCAPLEALPTTIVVPDRMLRDNLAWLITYCGDYRPFTAHCRVVGDSVASFFRPGEPHQPSKDLFKICCGLVIGESLARTGSLPSSPRTLPATLSFAIGRSLTLAGTSMPARLVAERWLNARAAAGLAPSAIDEEVLAAWQLAVPRSGPEVSQDSLFTDWRRDTPNRFWRSLKLGAMADQLGEWDLEWERLTAELPHLARLNRQATQSRETRLVGIESALQTTARALPADRDLRRRFCIAAGYLLASLAPGTLDHVGVLPQLTEKLPEIFLWYGLSAGLLATGRSSLPGGALGRLLLRDLNLPGGIDVRPSCDLGLEELVIQPQVAIRLGVSRLDVELLPGVATGVRWPSPQPPESATPASRAPKGEVARFIRDLTEMAKRNEQLVERAHRLLETPSPTKPRPGSRSTGRREKT